jgi:uncharacterized protein (DUF2062 family)
MVAVARDLASVDFLALQEQLDILLALGRDVFVAMWIGGLLVGAVAAAITYPLALRAVTRLRRRRERRRAARS